MLFEALAPGHPAAGALGGPLRPHPRPHPRRVGVPLPGGMQFPLALPYILGHALWQYMRLLVNRVAGVDQKQVDTDFKVKDSKDLT